MAEGSDADLMKGASVRRRVIVGVAAALAGLAVGSDANGQGLSRSPHHAPSAATDSARATLHRDVAVRTYPRASSAD